MVKFIESESTKGKNTLMGDMGSDIVRKNTKGAFYTYDESGKAKPVKKSSFFAGLSIQNPLDTEEKNENFFRDA